MLISRRQLLGWIGAFGAAGVFAETFRSLLRRSGATDAGIVPQRTDAGIVPQRTIEFHSDSNVYVIRDKQSVVRAVLHTQEPIAINAATACDAAEKYLKTHSQLLGLDASELRSLRLRPQANPTDAGVEYRLLSEKPQFDVTTVTFQQAARGLPVSQAGISVHLTKLPDRFEVICTHVSRDDTLTPASLMAPQQIVMGPRPLGQRILARQLGIADEDTRFEAESIRISHQRPMIYRYEAKKRDRMVQDTLDATGKIDPLAMPLPQVPAEIVDGSQNVVSAVYFDLKRKGAASTHWLALVEARTHAVLYLEEFTSDANGKVFLADPMTTHGAPLPTTDATNEKLNPLRVWKALPNLLKTDPQELIGSNVKIVDIEAISSPPPTMQGGADFEFDVRTDNFAAVNAYYSCDRFFTFIESLGFKRDDYFPWTVFPIAVDHRGTPSAGGATGDPTGDSAQTRGNSRIEPDGVQIRMGIESVVFALAQPNAPFMPPLGNANDWRLVLHELGGHGTLLNHVASTRFLFAHSAGDSLAAILNDPESNAEKKDETFPWLSRYNRWHNREVAGGWAWDGSRDLNDDTAQLAKEQILSTTHFRLYQSIGGGNRVQVDARRFAARYTAYLILRAIQTLTPATNPQHASDWMYNLIVADSGDWTSKGHSGGAYEKVIWWAFQKQGLFGGNPPPVDVYIDDGRDGEYQYQPNDAQCRAIWNRHTNDGKEDHQRPVLNLVNFAYVKIKNRGSQVATSVAVHGFQTNSRTNRNYPDDWTPMRTPRRSAPNVSPQSDELIVGPFEWIPAAGDNYILMAVSANGDPSNLRKFAAGKSIPDWRLVPHDNNLGMRKV
jgi:zinc metalloprotease ZmpB